MITTNEINELIEVVGRHAEKYPLAQPCDAVKLIYQSEFLGGHMIKSAEQSLLRLTEEFRQVEKSPGAELFEYIGNGVVRVNLAALDIEKYPLEALNRDFCESANLRRGSMEDFAAKLKVLVSKFSRFGFGFSAKELEDYLEKYREAGYPAVSHSEAYRLAYKPAYRVVIKKLPQKLHFPY